MMIMIGLMILQMSITCHFAVCKLIENVQATKSGHHACSNSKCLLIACLSVLAHGVS